jgi:hypothetical protein
MHENLHQSLIEVAEKYIGIKEATGHNDGSEVEMFQKAVDNKAQGESWCFEGDVEILTIDGWIKFKELDNNAVVAQIEDDLTINFVKPLQFIKKTYSGKGFNVVTRSLDFKCDNGHKFYGRFNNCKNLELDTLERASHSLQIPNIYSNSKGTGLNYEELSLLAIFLSDGYSSKTSGKTTNPKDRITVAVSKDRELKALENQNYLAKHKNKNIYGLSKTEITIYKFETPWFFDQLFNKYKEMKWEFVLSFNQTEARHFLKIFSQFDGNIRDNSIRLFSSNRVLADQLGTLAAFAGYCVNESVQYSPLSNKPNWIIAYTISENKNSRTIKKEHIKQIEFKDEELYCVSVPSQRILVRDKNHSIFMSGNCMAFVQFCLQQVEKAENIRSNVFHSEHCLTVWNKTDQSMHKITPSPGFIVIWQHEGTTNGHTGIVTGVPTDSTFTTIEGNTGGGSTVEANGDGVYRKTRNLHPTGNMKVVGFIDPFAETILP